MIDSFRKNFDSFLITQRKVGENDISFSAEISGIWVSFKIIRCFMHHSNFVLFLLIEFFREIKKMKCQAAKKIILAIRNLEVFSKETVKIKLLYVSDQQLQKLWSIA